MNNNIVKDFTPKELLDLLNLDKKRLDVQLDSGTTLEFNFEITANEYLEFAKIDLLNETNHGLINSLSNSKRAIDCEIDSVLCCFGLLSRMNFPTKLDLLRNIGVITPRIITKVIKIRNLVEHEFVKPDLEQVLDAFDIATLFVSSLDNSINFYPTDFYFQTLVDGVEDEGKPFGDKWLRFSFITEEKVFKLGGLIWDEIPTPQSRKAHWVESAKIHPKEKGFLQLIEIGLAIKNKYPDEKIKNKAVQFIELITE